MAGGDDRGGTGWKSRSSADMSRACCTVSNALRYGAWLGVGIDELVMPRRQYEVDIESNRRR
jgi:hypothetical protein